MDESDNHREPEAAETPSSEAVFDVPEAPEGRHGPGFLLGVLMGLLVGAGLATVFTPVSGDEVRVRATEKAPELWRHRDELTHEAREKARGAAGSVRSRLDEALQAGREAAREAQQEAHRRYEQMTGRPPAPPLP
jgi:gas vesicle protein